MEGVWGRWGRVWWLHHIPPPSPADPTSAWWRPPLLTTHYPGHSVWSSTVGRKPTLVFLQPSAYQHFITIWFSLLEMDWAILSKYISSVIFNFILLIVLFSISVEKNWKGSLVREKIFYVWDIFRFSNQDETEDDPSDCFAIIVSLQVRFYPQS